MYIIRYNYKVYLGGRKTSGGCLLCADRNEEETFDANSHL